MTAYFLLFLFNVITLPFVSSNHKKIYLILNGFFLWVIMGLRGLSVGSDTPSYVSIYQNINSMYIPHSFINWFFPQNVRFENGYLIFNKLLYSINPNPRFLLVVYTFICIICLLFMIDKLNISPEIGIISYEAIFMPFMMSGIRQAMAISFCMVAFVFVVKKDPWLFLLFNYLALSMHVTACVFLLTYLFNFFRKGVKSKTIVVGLMIAIFIGFDEIYSKLSVSSHEMQSFLVSSQGNNGLVNVILTVILSATILIWSGLLVRMNKEYINDEAQLRSYTFSKYLVWFIVLFMLISLRSSQLSRVALYFELGLIVLLGIIYSIFRNRHDAIMQVILIMALICYFVVIQTFRPEWSYIVPYIFIK